MAMIAMTTSSSINVKASFVLLERMWQAGNIAGELLQHELVIRRAVRHRQADLVGQVRQRPSQPAAGRTNPLHLHQLGQEFVERLAKAAGTESRLFSMPTSVLAALLRVSGRQEACDSLIGSLELDLSKAASTGWRPSTTLDEGLRLALAEPTLGVSA